MSRLIEFQMRWKHIYKRAIKEFLFPNMKYTNQVRIATMLYCEEIGVDKFIYGIRTIKAKNRWGCLHITFVLERAGIFIGRQGTNLNNLQEVLEKFFKKPVKIHLIENDPFTLER